jgi:hypothetical protein
VIDFMAAGRGRPGAPAQAQWAVVGAAIGTIGRHLHRLRRLIFLAARSAPPSASSRRSATLIRCRQGRRRDVAGWLIGTPRKSRIVFAMLGLFAVALLF